MTVQTRTSVSSQSSRFVLIVFLCAATGCRNGGGPSVRAAGSPQASVFAAGDKPIGVAECDRYLAMWQSCIATKVPREERGTEQSELDSARYQLAVTVAMAGTHLGAQACAKEIRDLKRNDLFECYGGRNSCSYVSKAEMEQLLGSSVADVTLSRQGCHYVRSDQPIGGTVVKVEWSDDSDAAKENMQAGRMGMQLSDRLLQASTGASMFPVDTLRGVGDEAFFAGLGTLYVRKGEALVTIDGMTASEDQKVAIARLVLGRL